MILMFAPIFVGAVIAFASTARAAAQRTFVASYGVAANSALNCSIAKPCRQFSEAIGVTISGGEIIVLDSAGYGPVTITQSVTITAPAGIYAGISVFSGSGVTVDGTGIDVTLEGLTITGQGGVDGIDFLHGATLTIERCRISRFTNAGIDQERGKMLVTNTAISDAANVGIATVANAVIEHVVVANVGGIGILVGDGGNVAIRNSSVSGVSGGIGRGIYVDTFAAAATVTLDAVSVVGCAVGINAFSSGGASVVDVVRSRISGNTLDGVVSQTVPSGSALVHVTDSLISNNGGAGLLTQGVGQMTASGSTVVSNKQYGFNSSNGGMFTMQNNQVRDNAPSNVNGTVHPLSFN